MTNFANYKNGQVTINTYRFIDAMLADIDDICDAYEKGSVKTLVASIDTDDEMARIKAICD